MIGGGIVLFVSIGSAAGHVDTVGGLDDVPMGGNGDPRVRPRLGGRLRSRRFTRSAALGGGIALIAGSIIRRAGLAALEMR